MAACFDFLFFFSIGVLGSHIQKCVSMSESEKGIIPCNRTLFHFSFCSTKQSGEVIHHQKYKH